MSRAKLRRFFRHGLLPQLLVFEAVARLGSVTRAAAELHLAQPTVSLQLKKLAETLEVTLFEQRGRSLHLTAAGQALRESCDEMLVLCSNARRKSSLRLRAPRAETLRLAAEPEARAVAARLIASFCARNPGVQVEPAHRRARRAAGALRRRHGRRLPLRAGRRRPARRSSAGACCTSRAGSWRARLHYFSASRSCLTPPAALPTMTRARRRAMEIPRDYNAAVDLIGRNLAAGRGGKVAYVDDAGSCHLCAARRARRPRRQRPALARHRPRGAHRHRHARLGGLGGACSSARSRPASSRWR